MPGDNPTPQERHRFAEDQIVPGRILYLLCPFTRPDPKNKYVVIASVDDQVCLFFVINSTRSLWVLEKSERRNCQVSITKEDYPFLDHESYVNCAQALESIDEAEMIRQIAADTSKSKGMLLDHTRQSIVGVVGASRVLEMWKQELILEALS